MPPQEFLLLNATEQRYEAQRLNWRLSGISSIRLPFATDQIHVRDNVRIDWDHNQDRLNFIRETNVRTLYSGAFCRPPLLCPHNRGSSERAGLLRDHYISSVIGRL